MPHYGGGAIWWLNMQIIKVLLIGFSPVTRAGLRAILASDESVQIVGEAADGAQALQELQRLAAQGVHVEVVLAETRTNEMDGVLATRLVKEESPETAVLILAEQENDAYVIDTIQVGAGGYLFLKETSQEGLLQSIHRVLEGGTQMSTTLLRSAVDHLLENGRRTLAERTAEAAQLTAREVNVLRLMGNGDSNKAIAENLGVSLDTVKRHVRHIIAKLNGRSRTHAAIIAAQAGIAGNPIQPPESGSKRSP
jgi:DNA-binding NarL/FixJ family response regulator